MWFTSRMPFRSIFEQTKPRMKNVLVTGFEPFGGDRVNPSALAAQTLDGRLVAGRRVMGAVLPCVFGKSREVLRREIRRVRPELVISAGQAGGQAGFAVERVAVNIQDAAIPDNAGKQPADRPVVRGGPAAYQSTLPVKAIVAALRESGLPAEVSDSADTFVCNEVFYALMRMLARTPEVRGGFIHVPWLPEQAPAGPDAVPGMPLGQIVRGLEIAIETSLRTQREVRATH
jgi:pyroglutamyl-peptidase